MVMTTLPLASRPDERGTSEPGWRAILAATAMAIAFVLITRWPVARTLPIESDEFGFLEEVSGHWFPMHHTLFKTSARAIGLLAGDPFRGFIALDMMTSAMAMVGVWWWLRAIVSPSAAAAGALVLGVAPNFWGYGAVAANYTAIVLVGSVLLGIAIRGHRRPESWQPSVAAAVLGLGAGYRSDIGLLWLPLFLAILWQHRWRPAIRAAVLLAAIGMAWVVPMLVDVGGWQRYREASAEFAHSAGALNSYWHLGFVDGPVRYAVKLGMALIGTLGPALSFVPRGLSRLRRDPEGGFLAGLLAISILPAMATHLLLHFGVPGYGFHYVPALLALIVLGIGRDRRPVDDPRAVESPSRDDRTVPRLLSMACLLAALFWFYPADFSAPGWRGHFDLAIGRLTRAGLNQQAPEQARALWRTANSRMPGPQARR